MRFFGFLAVLGLMASSCTTGAPVTTTATEPTGVWPPTTSHWTATDPGLVVVTEMVRCTTQEEDKETVLAACQLATLWSDGVFSIRGRDDDGGASWRVGFVPELVERLQNTVTTEDLGLLVNSDDFWRPSLPSPDAPEAPCPQDVSEAIVFFFPDAGPGLRVGTECSIEAAALNHLASIATAVADAVWNSPVSEHEPELRLLLSVETSGGCYRGGPFCTGIDVWSDGRFVRRSGYLNRFQIHSLQAGVLDRPLVDEFATLAASTDFDGLRASLGPGRCWSCVDGIDTVIVVGTPHGLEMLSSFSHDIYYSDAAFLAGVNDLLDTTGAWKLLGP